MRKLSLLLVFCFLFTLVFPFSSLAETGVGYNSGNIDVSGVITVTASSTPKYVYITIVNSQNVSVGSVSVTKPGKGTPELIMDFSGNTSKKISLGSGNSAGDYKFTINCTGSCTVNITLTK